MPWLWSIGRARSGPTAQQRGASRLGLALALLGLPFVGVVGLSGCRGWRNHGDTYYRHLGPRKRAQREATYRFGMPGGGWSPAPKIEDVQVAWINRDVAGVIEILATCDDQGDSSLDQYTDHLRIDWTDWVVIEQKQETVVGRDALRTVVTGELDGVPRKNEFVVLKKNGCLFDLRYSAAPSNFDGGRADFQRVVAGFRFPLRE